MSGGRANGEAGGTAGEVHTKALRGRTIHFIQRKNATHHDALSSPKQGLRWSG